MSDNLLAEYRWLADGTKTGVKDAAGMQGFEYLGSLVYKYVGGELQLESAAFGGGRIEVSEGSSGNIYTPNYYITDHLGSTRAILTLNPTGGFTVSERSNFMPFGTRWDNAQAATSRYQFSGKEDQTIGGLPYQDFGARFYGGKLPIWTAIDPLAEDYYPISPYAYTLNNPIKYTDPNGMEVWIYYDDEDGNEQRLLYTANMKYEGENSFVSNMIGNLNAVYGNGGGSMLDALIGSNNAFNILNQAPTIEGAGGTFRRNMDGGGTIFAGTMGKVVNFTNIEATAHEMFHGAQHEFGQGGGSIFSEVEAFVFGYGVATNWGLENSGGGSMSPAGRENEAGRAYESAFLSLQWKGYSQEAMGKAVSNFRNGAYVNAAGGYSNMPALPTPYNGGKIKSILGGFWRP